MLQAVMKTVGPPRNIKKDITSVHQSTASHRHRSHNLWFMSWGFAPRTAEMYKGTKGSHSHPSRSGYKPRSTSSRRRKRPPTMREDKDLPPAARRNWPLYSTGRTRSLLCSQPGNGHRTKSIHLTKILEVDIYWAGGRRQWRYKSAISYII